MLNNIKFMLNNNIKFMLNELQNHITKDTDKILLIFDNNQQLNSFKEEHQDDIEYMHDFILMTLVDLMCEYKLTGISFKRYKFMC